MNARLDAWWQARTFRERVFAVGLAVFLAALVYVLLVHTAQQARAQLGVSLSGLRTQAQRLERDAAEVRRLREAPPPAPSPTSLRVLVQAQIDAAGLAQGVRRIDAGGPAQVQAEFGALAFADWLTLVNTLQAQQVRLDTCRIEALSTPGLVSVNAVFVR